MTSTPPLIFSSVSTSLLEQIKTQFKNDPVLGVIQKNLPPAFTQSSLQERQDYCFALLASRRAKEALKELFKPLRGLAEFSEPLLLRALDAKFGAGLDVRKDRLFYAVQERATQAGTQLTLLESALHNFERKESVAGFLRKSSAILDSNGNTHPKAIKPDAFIDLCRYLNLGRQYQDHLKSVLEPDSAPGQGRDSARFNARATFIANDQADMEVYARAAAMKKTISQEACSAMVALARQKPEPRFNGELLLLQRLTLFGVEIPRVLLISPQRTWVTTQVPTLLYIPQDPVSPVTEYASLTALEDGLRSRLMDKSYQSFFAQLIGERQRAAFFTRLNKHLFPLVPQDGSMFTLGLWHHSADPTANLVVDTDELRENPFSRMHRQHVFLLKDNARFLAVPTEEEDAKTRQERLQLWLSVGMNILNLASFVIPPLGAVMMIDATVELIGEVYHGLQDLSHGDMEEGLDHLMGAAEQIAFMAALAAGHTLPEPPPILSNNFVGKVIPIKLSNGQTRLWKPDLTPFEFRSTLPEGASPDLNGVIEHKGKKYLTIEDKRYEVQHHAPLNRWVIKHPNNTHMFSPALEHNGVGAFRHEGESPHVWAKNTLFKRLGHSVVGLSESASENILAIADIDDSILRQVHVDSVPPPGQLDDTIKRFQLDLTLETSIAEPGSTRAEHFERLYNASEVTNDPLVKLIQRDFPTTPTAVAQDLLVTLTSEEKQQMLNTGRIPLRVGEAAVWQQKETRLNRALEGFYLGSVNNADTDTLRLRLLEKLPGWSDQVRIEVREGSRYGTVLESIGEPQAPERKVLVKSKGRYQAFDAEGNSLNGISPKNSSFCDSILHALSDGPRRALGFPHPAQGAALNKALAGLAVADRGQVSRLLGQQKPRLKFNSPTRIKQVHLGYALSGRGALAGDILEDHLLDKIGLLELEDITPQQALVIMRDAEMTNADISARLDVLLEERQALRASLGQWCYASSAIRGMSEARMVSRTRIGEAIIGHWQSSSLATPSEGLATLRLESIGLEDFPEQLPEFFIQSVQRLEMSNVVTQIGRTHELPFQDISLFVLETFLSRFAHITSLEMRSSIQTDSFISEFYALPHIVSTHLPNLRTLSVINQGLDIRPANFELFTRLPHLERLDLSGNRFTFFDAPAGSVHLNLQYLGLDRVGLERWPVWLNALLPNNIAEVSLGGNHIAMLPDAIIDNELSLTRKTRIGLLGNQLSRSAIIQALLGEARAGRSFTFDLDVPPELQSHVVVLLQEQAELETALRDWEVTSSAAASPFDDRALIRSQMSETLLSHWIRAVAGRTPLAVLVESSRLSDFPQVLPNAFYRNVTHLTLRNVIADDAQLEQFLRRFQHATSLAIVEHSPLLVTPPRVLAELPRLRELVLTNQQMLINQEVMEFLRARPHLQHLDLSGNTLGPLSNTPLLTGRYWDSLTLDNTGLTQWPEWLSASALTSISSLSLCENGITELPEDLLRNPRSDSVHTEISLNGNPLSRETMILAHVGEHGHHRSYSFYMDLPDDIRNLPTERAYSSEPGSSDLSADSDSDSDSDFALHRHGAAGSSTSVLPSVEPWLIGSSEEVAAHRALWDRLETAADAPRVLTLISRLQESSDFIRARSELTSRVWSVLEAAQDVELRALLNVMAEEPIVNRTCADGIRLQFNQMEVQVYTRNSLRGIPESERGPTLYRLMRQLYRLDEVDRIALANNRGRDAAEVRLAYRLGLAERLGLPQPPTSMLYRVAASVTPDELTSVQAEVMTHQNSASFLASAADRDFWVSWLRDGYAGEFAELETTFQQERARLEDEFSELNDEYLNRAKLLQQQQKDRERNFINQLTHREGLKYDD
ncbi:MULTISPECIES: NEL-type E3 ubiquitin ligase domain-containing protein [unclassified Pseudomonas]|uniref:NEL-type E3 ubiquitin ligase domain-containing protein n=1 Tax=unclassified Pseudomonas TaxID=196821 RepID=UPI002AC92541|nr:MULTISPECIES: NEL-type E3 ubiquitin ligase domain-containing protein [unclassified Pseudomonas]